MKCLDREQLTEVYKVILQKCFQFYTDFVHFIALLYPLLG